jgi:hypothetical protein
MSTNYLRRNDKTINIRVARRDEFSVAGELMVRVYSSLDGFPTPIEQPNYYAMFADVGRFTKNGGTEVLVAVTADEAILGAVVLFGEIKFYGSGGTVNSNDILGLQPIHGPQPFSLPANKAAILFAQFVIGQRLFFAFF